MSKPFYHGTYGYHPYKTVFEGRGEEYHAEWVALDHYEAIHHHAPAGALHHRDAVFMCDKINDIDACGGATEVVALLRPLGPVNRHDMQWTGHISLLLDRGLKIDDPEVAEACRRYWDGTPKTEGEALWEYITPKAEVLACCDYEDPDVEMTLREIWEECCEEEEEEMGMAP